MLPHAQGVQVPNFMPAVTCKETGLETRAGVDVCQFTGYNRVVRAMPLRRLQAAGSGAMKALGTAERAVGDRTVGVDIAGAIPAATRTAAAEMSAALRALSDKANCTTDSYRNVRLEVTFGGDDMMLRIDDVLGAYAAAAEGQLRAFVLRHAHVVTVSDFRADCDMVSTLLDRVAHPEEHGRDAYGLLDGLFTFTCRTSGLSSARRQALVDRQLGLALDPRGFLTGRAQIATYPASMQPDNVQALIARDVSLQNGLNVGNVAQALALAMTDYLCSTCVQCTTRAGATFPPVSHP